MKFAKLIGTLSVIAVAVGAASAQDAQTPAEICAAASTDEPTTREYTQAEQVLEAGVDYRAILCTESGPVYVDLFERIAPLTVNSFVFLAENGYYNNTTFHRVLQDFMAQAGDPTGTGSGGPGYQFANETPGFVTFDRPGLLAMANAGPGTNGSQFFITTTITDWLNGQHTIFGDVLEGYENVTALKLRDPNANPTEDGAKLDTVVIITDPATVKTTFVAEETGPIVASDVVDALALSVTGDALPADLNATQSGEQTLEDVVASAPEDLREDYRAFLEKYGFQYRAAVTVEQAGCVVEYGFDSLGYHLDAFDSVENATAALNDGFLDTLAAANGYEKIESAAGTLGYSLAKASCSDAPALFEQYIMQRGRYLATVTGTFDQALTDQAPIDTLLGNSISAIFESGLGGVFRSEIR